MSADGRFILTGSDDMSARLWDAATGREIRRFRGHSDKVRCVAFSPDARYVLTGSEDATARIWDAASGRETRRLEGHTDALRSVAFSADGRFVLSASNDRTVRLWVAATGREIRQLACPHDCLQIQSAAFSADSPIVISLEMDGSATVWRADTGREIGRFHNSSRHADLQFSADGRRAVRLDYGEAASVWDVATGKEIRRFPGKVGWPVVISPDGGLVLVGMGEDAAVLWNAETGGEVCRFRGHFGPLTAVSFSEDRRLVVSGGEDKIASLWDTATGREIRRFEGHTDLVEATVFSPDGRFLLTAGGEGVARLWDLASGREVRRFTGHSQLIEAVAFSPDGHFILTGSEDSTARLWEAGTGREVRRFEGEMYRVCTVAFSADGRRIVTASQAGGARLWDLATGREIRHFEIPSHPSRLQQVDISRDGRLVLTGDDNGPPLLWDVASGREIRRFEGEDDSIFAVKFSPDGRAAVAAGGAGTCLWEVATGRKTRCFEVPVTVRSMAFSPDGRFILTGSEDSIARLWDAADGREIRRFEGHLDWVNSVAYSADGRLVVTGSSDGTSKIWAADTGTLLATLISFTEGGWAVVDADGRFDTDSLDGQAPLHWIVDDDPLRPLPLEIFMRQYYTPKLLAKAIAREKLPAVPNMASLNRVQPLVSGLVIDADPGSPGKLRARVRVAMASDGKGSSGARDLRIFRNGQLVRFQEGSLEDGEYVFNGIAAPASRSMEFAAYAFNTDLVKSDTVQATFQRRDAPAAPHVRTFLINIGVNRNRAAGCDLQYAVADARELGAALEKRLPAVTRKLLVSADDTQLGGASKESIRESLAAVAREATPDDIFIFTYSGHGYTDRQGLFYLFPSSLQGSCDHADDAALLASAISSDELTGWLRAIDAGEMVMILDACHSAASVEAGDFKPGPMGSKGLGQLAYDKRIRILAASQSTQAAMENPWLNMGLLTYALTRDGLEAGAADWHPRDGKIWLREWLEYGVERVPELYEALQKGNGAAFRNARRGVRLEAREKKYAHPSLQTPALYDFTRREQVGVRLR
jgi:WD40 repeat protein